MYSKTILQDFARAWATGLTYTELQEKFKIARGTVTSWRRELALAPRKTGPRRGIRREQ